MDKCPTRGVPPQDIQERFSSPTIYTLGASLVAQMVKNLPVNARDAREGGFDPWVRKIPLSRKWQPTLVFLPGEFYEQRGLTGYSSWGSKELDPLDLSLSILDQCFPSLRALLGTTVALGRIWRMMEEGMENFLSSNKTFFFSFKVSLTYCCVSNLVSCISQWLELEMQGLSKKYIETPVHIKILFYFFLFNSDKRKDFNTEFIGSCLNLFSFCLSQNSICKIPKSRWLERVEGQSNSLFMVSPSVSFRQWVQRLLWSLDWCFSRLFLDSSTILCLSLFP